MANWNVEPKYKKSIEEHELWQKDDMVIRRITSWRGGTWYVVTSDDNPPEFNKVQTPFGSSDEDSVNMYDCCENNIEDVEMLETWDGWYSDIIWPDDMEEDERERIEALMQTDWYEGLEGDGWINYETEMWVWGDLEITKDES